MFIYLPNVKMLLATYSPQVLVIICVVIFHVNCVTEKLVPPVENSNSSVRYLLFTPSNPQESCLLEPTQEALQECHLDPEQETIFLIHGYNSQLNPKNQFYVIKNKLLGIGLYNVIILDWDKYSNSLYPVSVANVYLVGAKLAEMVNFLKDNVGIKAEDIRMIGHSLGAHLAGVAGRKISNLANIIGLDPAGPLFVGNPKKLSYEDALFVQVIHTSSYEKLKGFGLSETMGHTDFYVNGGYDQPGCKIGVQYTKETGMSVKISNQQDSIGCSHSFAVTYFIQSLDKTECRFIGTLCKSYEDFKNKKCLPPKSVTAEMGFFAKKDPDLQPHSKFYLRTSDSPPYCLKDGFEP